MQTSITFMSAESTQPGTLLLTYVVEVSVLDLTASLSSQLLFQPVCAMAVGRDIVAVIMYQLKNIDVIADVVPRFLC